MTTRDIIVFITGFGVGSATTLIAFFYSQIQAKHIVGWVLILQMVGWTVLHLAGIASEPNFYVFGLGAGGATIFVPEVGDFLKNWKK